MTKSSPPPRLKPSGQRRCRWCGRAIPPRPGPGRPADYCRPSHRQRDFESRRREAELGRSDGEVVSARTRVDAVLDQVYLLECTVADVGADLGDDDSPDAVRRALAAVLEAIRPLAAARVAG